MALNPEIVSIIRRMDTGMVETQLALQCAPLIAGLRFASLLFLPNSGLACIRRLLERRRIRFYVLFCDQTKSCVFLYYGEAWREHRMKRDVREFLREYGYSMENDLDTLSCLRRRYAAYRVGMAGFPHEIGALLGYPLEDVRGFIENQGRNYLYTGYWKVYRNPEAKKKVFRMYELARETFIELIGAGTEMADIMDAYRGNLWPGM